MIKININVLRINKARIEERVSKAGKKGKYLELVCFDKPDSFNNDGFVCHSVSQEERLAGVKGEILGNWRYLGGQAAPKKKEPDRVQDDEDDISF